MQLQSRQLPIVLTCILAAWLTGACATVLTEPVQRTFAPTPAPAELVKVKVVVKPEIDRSIPKKSRIVITDFDGRCASEVRDALMRRLVDNTDYDVVTRSFLGQIVSESEQAWAGKFNTETATRLGDLMAASVFVVGRVAYCGSSGGLYSRSKDVQDYNIAAVLQILDIRTGKVLVSSSSEGHYRPDSARLMVSTYDETSAAVGTEIAAVAQERQPQSRMRDMGRRLAQSFQVNTSSRGSSGTRDYRDTDDARDTQHENRDRSQTKDEKPKDKESKEPRTNYPAFKAAEDLANGFANKFFARPTWEDVTMWTSPQWSYGESIRYVKLGHCHKAVEILENSLPELQTMSDADIANYLHNMGVALLCNNQPELAIEKLRSAYRITYNPQTLEMMELASRLIEWSLAVAVDVQPEIEFLTGRTSNPVS